MGAGRYTADTHTAGAPPPFGALEGAKAKWDQSFHDFKCLQNAARRFEKGQPHRIVVKFDPKSGWHTAYLQVVQKPDPQLGVLAGSIAYQSLSALNLIAWELAVRKIGWHKVFEKRIHNHIAFPISKTPSDFKTLPLIHHAYVSKQAATLLCKVQPYNRLHGPDGPAQHSLFFIKFMADSDKHRVLAPILGRINFAGSEFVWDYAVARNPTIQQRTTRSTANRVIRDGTPLNRIRFEVGNAKAKVRVNRQPAFEVAFAAPGWMVGMDSLAQCVADTRWTIRQLAPLFPREADPWESAGQS